MEFGKPFIVSADDMDLNVPADYNSISDNNCNFSKTNVWNNNFSAPEMTCDFAVLHRDLQEIKSLINDIKNCIKDFFSEQ